VEFIRIFSRITQPSHFFAARAQLTQYGVDTAFINNPHALGRDPQRHKAFFRFHPKAMIVQIGKKTPLGAILGVGNIVTGCGPLTRNLTDS